MKKKLFLLTALTLCLAVLNSCQGDKDEVTTKTIVGKWKQINGIYSPAYFGETDYFASYLPCEKDDIVEFKANGSFEKTEGSTKCDQGDPQIIDQGSYSVNAGFTTLIIHSQTLTIELTANTLKLHLPSFVVDNITYTDVATYQRQ
jgi:hypothetical protein